MGDSNDVKLLRLTMMLMCNLLSQEHLYAATVSFVFLFLLWLWWRNSKDTCVFTDDREKLKKLVVRLKCGDKARIGLKDVVDKLENCLFDSFSESEQ